MPKMQREPAPADRPLSLQGYGSQARRAPAPVSLLLSLLVLAGVGGGVFWLYRGGIRAPGGPPEPVGAPVRDVRVAAPPQPTAVDPAAGLTIYKDDPNATPAAPAFAPPPEQPAPRPQVPVAAPMAPAPAATAVGKQVLYAPTPETAPSPLGSSTLTETKPAAKGGAKAKGAAKDDSIDTLLASATAKPDSKPKSPTLAAAKPAPSGAFQVQIGAFSSQALADKSWQSAAGVAPADMAGKGKHVAQVTKDGATLYRTAVTGFETREAALNLCAKLTAAGRTCFVR